jgi:hypothetical protein
MRVDHERRAKRPTFPVVRDSRDWAGRELTDRDSVDAEDGYLGWRRSA